MTAPRRRFEVVAPDWGQTHLTSDAVVAFVDDELSLAAHARATRHLDICADCAAEVREQVQTRSALRSADTPTLSTSLLHTLRAIPRDAELPGPPAGLAIAADGGLVQTLRCPAPAPAPEPVPRRRIGAGVAVSGLALGALALALPFLPADQVTEQGAFGGSVLGGPVFGGTVLYARSQAPAAGASEPVGVEPPFSADRAVTATLTERAPERTAERGPDAVMERLDGMPAAFRSARR